MAKQIVLRYSHDALREKVIELAVEALTEFGYNGVNKENIMTDKIFKAFFWAELLKSKGQNAQLDEVIQDIIKDLNQ